MNVIYCICYVHNNEYTQRDLSVLNKKDFKLTAYRKGNKVQ